MANLKLLLWIILAGLASPQIPDCENGGNHKDCKHKCLQVCVNADNSSSLTCDYKHGPCSADCQKGYDTEWCADITNSKIYEPSFCANGTSEAECRSNCSYFCLSEFSDTKVCNSVNGSCLDSCQDGFVSKLCDQSCSTGKLHQKGCRKCPAGCASSNESQSSPCDHNTGHCLNGCEAGYTSVWCNDTCPPGRYGDGCSLNCSSSCVYDSNNIPVCDHRNGSCLFGCQAGYMSTLCDEVCQIGKFGQDCSFNCSLFCLTKDSEDTSVCDHVNGTCECQVGYHTPWCNQTCTRGTFGQDCSSICSQNCQLNTDDGIVECDHVTGTCECQSGYDTPWCNQTCPRGTFGQDCSSICSQYCQLNTDDGVVECDHVTGTCECQSGYDTPWCNQTCPRGTFGQDCNSVCSQSCQLNTDDGIAECDHVTGTCECQSGYDTPWCNQICPRGTFGQDCSSVCSQYCQLNTDDGNVECDHVTGTCDCQNGYGTPWCNLTCPEGLFGPGCTSDCSQFCQLDGSSIPNCDRVTGTCECQSGYTSPWCNQSCPVGSFGGGCQSLCSQFCELNNNSMPVCHNIDGTCQCQSGYSTPWCNESCPVGSFGEGCQSECSEFCVLINGLPECDHVNGTCECSSGYSTPWCNQFCPDGTFGDGCLSTCSQYCVVNSNGVPVCHHISGECECQSGYDGAWCNQTCPLGSFGDNCLSTCSAFCLLDSDSIPACHHIDGTCKCQSGYDTRWCNQSCASGNYGEGCQSPCSPFCLLNNDGVPECHHVTGTCQCQNGYDGPWCNQTCPQGMFGQRCSSNCSAFCVVNDIGLPECNHITGECQCQSGYRTLWCNQSCLAGTYGEACSSNCSQFCTLNDNTPACHHVTGICKCQSGYETSWCTEMTQKDTESAGEIGAVVGAVVAIVGAAVGAFIFWYYKKSKRKDRNKDDGQSPSETELTELNTLGNKTPVTKSWDCYDYLPDQSPTIILLKDLDTFMATHNRSFFLDQFSTIPVNNIATTHVGQREENRYKNRYRNIIPYDHSRVRLLRNEKLSHEEYINASHIEGYSIMDKFISSQGPTKSSLEDFARMLWEQNVEKIVMLTNLVEQGKEKCEKYWPEDGEMKLGQITVLLISTQIFADYTIRKLHLRKTGKPDRLLTHFHYTAWPDLDVPLSPWGLVDFEQRVASIPSSKPVVVHCSAGVGRTGTFIALQNVIRQAEDKGYIDFFATVQNLRCDRLNMVQTSKQYEFLHKAAQVALLCKGTTVASDDLDKRIHYLEEVSELGVTNMEREFRAICALIDDGDDEFVDKSYSTPDYSRNATNKHKNRLNNIVPKMQHAPVLVCETDYLGDYINAVFVPSFRRRDQHFLTQLPLPSTVIDFWRLVTQFRVSLIVAFENDLQDTDSTVGEYLPLCDRRVVTVSMFEIESEIVSEDKLWEQRKVTVTTDTAYKNTKVSTAAALKEEHVLTHLRCTTTDLDSENLLALVRHVRSLCHGDENRTVYMCRNGAEYSGLVYVLSLLMDRMDNDGSSAVPLVVGATKAIRPQVIPTLAQYQLLFQALLLYSGNSNVYATMDSPM